MPRDSAVKGEQNGIECLTLDFQVSYAYHAIWIQREAMQKGILLTNLISFSGSLIKVS